MDSPIEDIKKKIDIVDFINSFITTKKSGRNFKSPCPFHQEKTPSFVISPERQIWHCFGACQEGGDIFKFLMKWENITFPEAIKELAEKAGVPLQKIHIEDKIWKKKERLIAINTLSAQYFEHLLFRSSFGRGALDFLSSRSINLNTAQKFQLGYAPDSWDSLLKFLKKKKFTEEEIFDTGLLVKGVKGNFYDRFRGRLIFPIKDTRGNIVGFSARSLKEEDTSAKYINVPETLLYHKRETLFGIDIAKEAIKQEKNAYIVEGEFDVISPYQHGFENFIAIKGSALTKEQLMLLKRYTNTITLMLDADTAGEEAMKRGVEEAEALDFDVRVVILDFAKDPDEAVRKDNVKFKKALRTSLPIYDFIIDIVKRKFSKDDPFSKKKIADEIAPFISKIRNPIVQSHYIKKIAELLQVDGDSVKILLTKRKKEKEYKKTWYSSQKSKDKQARDILIEKYLLSLIFQSNTAYEKSDIIFHIIMPEDFSLPSLQKISAKFLSLKKKHGKAFDYTTFLQSLEKELQPVCDELFLFASIESEFSTEAIEKLAYEVKKNSLKRKIAVMMNKEVTLSAKDDELRNFNMQLKEIEKKLVTV